MPFSLLSDSPATRDLLDFDRYAQPLLEILESDTIVTPLTIGIFGTWGSGKSTLLGILSDKLEKDVQKRFVCVKFNPWVHRKEANLLIPLLHALRDTLALDPQQRFKASAEKILDVLVRLGADLVLKHFTGGVVSLDKLEKYEKAYLERRAQAESQLRNLRKSLEDEAKALHKAKARLIFFIDDLDRCDPEEIIDLLESIKLFLDVENVVHVLAVDKEIIDRGVQVKYGKFEFAKTGRESLIGAEYLEKMIQVPVHLFPLHPTQVTGYIKALDQSQDVQNQMALLAAALSPNPRKIKRLLNAIAFTNYILNSDPKHYGNLDRSVATALGVIRVEEPGLYLEVSHMPNLLVAMEEAYANQRNPKTINDFMDFQEKAEAARAICETYYRPASFLAGIFQTVKFSSAAKTAGKNGPSLADYISVLGGF